VRIGKAVSEDVAAELNVAVRSTRCEKPDSIWVPVVTNLYEALTAGCPDAWTNPKYGDVATCSPSR
jgi:hypothetical protein